MLSGLPNGRTLAACNFHIKAWLVRTIGCIVWTVDLMHEISIYEARASRPWRLPSRRLDFECMTCLKDERIQTGIHILSSHICVLERKPIADQTLSGVRMCCWNVRTDASWNSSKLLDTKDGSDGKFSSFGRMMLWTIERPDSIPYSLDDCKRSDFTNL
jgi:hypothetical protein